MYYVHSLDSGCNKWLFVFYMEFLFPCQRVDRQHLLCSKGQTINHCGALRVLWCDWDLWNLTFSYVWVKVWLWTLIETNEPAKLMLLFNICCIQFYQTFSFIFSCQSCYSTDIGPPKISLKSSDLILLSLRWSRFDSISSRFPAQTTLPQQQ